MLKNIMKTLVNFLLLSALLLFVPATYAQRPAGQCGQQCVGGACAAGKYCSGGTCYETGCNPLAGDSACCKSQRPVQPRTPTSTPGGGVVVPPKGTTPATAAPGPTGGTNLTPGTTPLTPFITAPVGGGGSAGDCSGPVEGTKDGKVDLSDFNLLRKEFSGTVKTAFCDFDTNGIVDLLDFNIQRIALIAQK